MTSNGRVKTRRQAPAVGDYAVTAVPVATVWSSPESVRPVDAPAVSAAADVRRWAAAMTTEQLVDLDGRALTQLLLGERVLVCDIVGDWAQIVAVQQPAAKLDDRGYPGMVPLCQLTAESPGPPAKRRVVVDATATALRDEPNGDVVLPGVVIGTLLPVAGTPERGWLPVTAPAGTGPLWVRQADVAPEPTEAPSGKELLAVAERLVDVPYVWGGMSAYGIDCSGLVHLAYRRLGITVPRDADDQAVIGSPVADGTEQPGDLYFFAHDGRPPNHIGIVAAAATGTAAEARHILHASGQASAGRVISQPMPEDRLAALVEIRRSLS